MAPDRRGCSSSLQAGREVVLDIEKPVLGGYGLGRVDGLAVFVEGALPGRRLSAQITLCKSGHAWAKTLAVLQESPDFRTPGCPHFGLCGGCDWLHMDYARQIHWKRELVRETLRRLGRVQADVSPTIASPVLHGYRNKMEFAFAPSVPESGGPAARPFALGMRPRGAARSVVPIRSCLLCSRSMIRVRALVEEWALESGLPAYEPDTGKGFWRHLVLREGCRGTGILACVITGSHPGGRGVGPALAEHLKTRAPEVSSLVHALRRDRALVARGERIVFISGPGRTQHHLGGLALEVSSLSFFQINTTAAEKLCEVVRDLAGLTGRETVWDLYSGVGSLALCLARDAGQVVGMEAVASAVQDARANARRNDLAGCRFLVGDAARTMDQALDFGPSGQPDTIVADPPRAGIQPEVVARLLEIRAPRLILVSCNPATLARDIGRLSAGYVLDRVQPVDMFPYTSHIESVARLAAR